METTVDRITTDTATLEIATIHHNGHNFTALGSVVSENHIIAYCGKDKTVTTWEGDLIGRYSIVSSWRINAMIADRRYSICATINGRKYHGQTYGEGFIVSLRPYKNA